MRTALIAALLFSVVARAAAAPARPAAPGARDEPDEKTLFGVGLAVGDTLEVFSLTPAELEIVLKGVRDGVRGKAKSPYDATVEAAVSDLARARAPRSAELRAAREKRDGAEYLAKVTKENGARKTTSGAIVLSEREGTGVTPTVADKVRVKYTGTLVSGRVFDASSRQGGSAEFPLRDVIKCWTEALQLMRVGGKAKVVCPSDTAYGPTGNKGIPGNAVLTFHVELVDVLK
jgi:FKBP-type peptidyl-prolyl cis-trans isomerase